ncbi:M64 family metallopeptidase, partial [Candidatus Micrarchaeota archaeon]|nr:M64 family metallopeptidase [Candidatus Micrarchaeota archaeon]
MNKNLLGLFLILVIAIIIIGIIQFISPFGAPVGAPGRGTGKDNTPIECDDHIDNDGDGYCDFYWKKGYCSDGSTLGDPDCESRKDKNESYNCIPSQEICDGEDNDCDGLIDEDLSRDCTIWCGPGIQYCENGLWGECIADCNESLSITYGPEVNEVGVDYVTAYWETNQTASYNEIQIDNWSPTPYYGGNTQHYVTQYSLSGGTSYEYKVRSCIDSTQTDCIDSAYYSFTTNPYGTCNNNYQDPGETDVDCGGSICPPCQTGQGCDVNSDCTSNTCVNGVCVDHGMCKELFPGTNNAAGDRVNVIFIGLAYSSKNEFLDNAEKAVDYYGNLPSSGPGLLEMDVYENNTNKFNFWYVDQIFTPDYPVDYCTDCRNAESYTYCQGLANTYRVNLCDISFRSCAYLGGSSYVSVTGSNETYWPYVFDHEFQHQFPRLRDEYVESSLGDRPGTPNCANDLSQAESWWGSLVGESGQDGQIIGYYDGCSYVYGNYRPTINSVMKSWNNYNLGLV